MCCLAEYWVRRANARNCFGKVICLIVFENEFTPGVAAYYMSMCHKLPGFLLEVASVYGRWVELL